MSTKIEWCNDDPEAKGETWNPTIGCRRVSPGCGNCYAEEQAARIVKMERGNGRRSPYEDVVKMKDGEPQAAWNGKAKVMHDRIDQPIRWRKRRRIFVNSMSDIAHEDVPRDVIAQIWAVMLITSLHADRGGHAYIVLTKRIERLRSVLTAPNFRALVAKSAGEMMDDGDGWNDAVYRHVEKHGPNHPLIRVGVSVEDQATADKRIPVLLQTPAAVRIVSAEPLLAPIDFQGYPGPRCSIGYCCDPTGTPRHEPEDHRGIGQIIVGGESGHKARPCHEQWVRNIVDGCKFEGIACFVKQLGAVAKAPGGTVRNYFHPKGGDMSEWPVDLRVRQDVGQA